MANCRRLCGCVGGAAKGDVECVRQCKFAAFRMGNIMAPPFRHLWIALTAFLMLSLGWPAMAETGPLRIGIVLMHGKGGSPTRLVADLAAVLEGQGFLVANPEMPRSGRRNYDVDVGAAEREVEAALQGLREKGAQKLFVAGHSQGGVFALYFGTRHLPDGVIAIAPGGNVGNSLFLDKLGETVELARQLVAEGKAMKNPTGRLRGAKGNFRWFTTPAIYRPGASQRGDEPDAGGSGHEPESAGTTWRRLVIIRVCTGSGSKCSGRSPEICAPACTSRTPAMLARRRRRSRRLSTGRRPWPTHLGPQLVPAFALWC